MESLLCLQISEKQLDRIRTIIVEMLRESGAKCGLLLDTAGNLLVRKGFTLIRDIDTLGALIAASRASTRAIAHLLGQTEVSVIFHQGLGDHIHSSDVGPRAILTLIFDDRADLSQLQGVVNRRLAELVPLLEIEPGGEGAYGPGIEKLGDEADKKLGSLFAERPKPESRA